MRRLQGSARPGWEQIVEGQGLGFHRRVDQGDGRPYWDESVHYSFTMAQVEDLEYAVENLHDMCLRAVEHVVKHKRFADFAIPEWLWKPIAESWKRRDPHVFGRFDLCYDGTSHAKLLEYNADTPTSLPEAAVVQWHWKQDVHPDADQWNSIHEQLEYVWLKENAKELHIAYSGADESGEDEMNAAYMAEVASIAGKKTTLLKVEDIGCDGTRFYDQSDRPIGTLFALYPWEWLTRETFGETAVEVQKVTPWVEPLWKMLLSNKALLAVLWELFPDHPNLLPAYLGSPRDLSSHVAKPLLGREGANILISQPYGAAHKPGPYGAEGYVYQEFWPLPEFDGWRPVLGAWVIGNVAAGLGIRETRGLITDNTSSFVPHLIEG